MGLTKTYKFNKTQNEIANIAKVLGHPARIAIIQQMIKRNDCVCSELVVDIGLAQATISQHLKELKNIGIIKGRISGPSMCYCIDAKRWSQIKNKIESFFNVKLCGDENCC